MSACYENSIEFQYLQDSSNEFREMKPHFKNPAHHEDCRQCEAFIKKGCECCHWFHKHQDTINYSILTGRREYSQELRDEMRAFAENWIETSKVADAWIKSVEERDYFVDNKIDFLRCREMMLEWLETDSWDRLSQEAQAFID